jgi:hypothetical protein
LRTLAGQIVAVRSDAQSGPYTYHHYRRWILSSTGFPAPRPDTTVVVAIDVHRWDAGDHSAIQRMVQLPPNYTLTAANPDYRSTDAEFAHTTPALQRYRPQETGSPIIAPLARDPAALARQLAYDPRPQGPQATLFAVEELYRAFEVPRAVRAAVLRVLAATHGLTYTRQATDRLGRRGIAVSHTAGNTRYTLIFDPAGAELLAAEQRLTGPDTHLDVPPGMVTYYTLLLEHGRRAQAD